MHETPLLTAEAAEQPSPPADSPRLVLIDLPDAARAAELESWLRAVVDEPLAIFSDIEGFEPGLETAAGRALVLCAAPDEAMAASLHGESLSSDLLSDWRRRVTLLCRMQRANRHRVALVSFDTLRATPLEVLAHCGVRLRGQADAAPAFPTPVFPLEAPPALQRLLCQELLRRDRAARALASELEAAAITLSGPSPLPDIDAILAAVALSAEQQAQTLAALAAQTRDLDIARNELDTAQEVAQAFAADLAERNDALAQLQPLPGQLGKVRSENEKFRKRVRDLEQDIARTRTGKEAEVAALAGQIAELRQGLEGREAALAQQGHDLEAAHKVIGAREDRIVTLEQALAETQAEQAAILRRMLELQAEMAGKKAEISGLLARIEQLGQGLEGSEKALAQRDRDLATARAELDTARAAARALEADLAERDSALAQMQPLPGQLEEAQTEIGKYRKRVRELEQDITEARTARKADALGFAARMKDTRQDLDAREKALAQRDRDLATARAELDAARAAAQALEADLAERERALAQLQPLPGQLEEAQTEIGQYRTRLRDLEQDIAESRAEQTAVLGQLLKTQERVSERDREIEEIRTAHHELDKSLSDLRGEHAKVRADHQAALGDVAARDGEIARIMSSRSIRITAPLRWLTGLLVYRR